MASPEIIIIGGGPAGLSAAGALKHAGLNAAILDRSSGIGQSWEQRYERLHLHTVRGFSGLAHYPIPRSYPKYLSKDQYAQYLRDYAAHFDLRFTPNVAVRCIRPAGSNGSRRWRIDTGSEDQPETLSADVVVIATGYFGKPLYPQWPGMEAYTGEVLHSAQYRSGRAYHGRRVLVIGCGNSGAEIAADLVEHAAAQVTVSLRHAPPFVPRDFLGTPAQVFGILMHPLPPRVGDRVGRVLSRLALGDLRRWGLPQAGWQPFSSHRTPVIDVGFAPALKSGRIALRPQVQAFTPDGVIFADGRREPFDAVILATGFTTGLETLLEPAGLLDAHGFPRFASGVPTNAPGLYFMGYFDSLRGFLYESNLASRRLAREVKKREG